MINRRIVAAVLGFGLAIGASFGAAAQFNCGRCEAQKVACIDGGGSWAQCERAYVSCMSREGCMIP
ncbi:hypothetical protein [Gallaecimonas xiamenensis]|uniref:Lipoprotein n=1 Tax=Gallaecimonas xiamenensis 3-C-1 TaxID=745411 RepID=K2IY51_9GAMM|nr:hypothetical protein [Gallaecimonas xiamenensis]EKE67758.1 hypothetical protein B3C1_18116 [Gallaecimonas xiamenensis 3-C-1]